VLTVADLNGLDEDAFTAALDGIFEHTPAIARRAWAARPFTDRDDLLRVLVSAAESLGRDERLALLRAHPRLGARGPMAERSVAEQAGAGLDAPAGGRDRRLAELNDAYEARFGFPFIVAVRGLSPDDVLARLSERVHRDAATEEAAALAQVTTIAGFRLSDLVGDT
jgi:2-oxo-4-hydroxy-4-carboxy-5-ureidoimidazoline decarboxylase